VYVFQAAIREPRLAATPASVRIEIFELFRLLSLPNTNSKSDSISDRLAVVLRHAEAIPACCDPLLSGAHRRSHLGDRHSEAVRSRWKDERAHPSVGPRWASDEEAPHQQTQQQQGQTKRRPFSVLVRLPRRQARARGSRKMPPLKKGTERAKSTMSGGLVPRM